MLNLQHFVSGISISQIPAKAGVILFASLLSLTFVSHDSASKVQAAPTDVPTFVRLLPENTSTFTYAPFSEPSDVALGLDDSMYVLDSGSDCVKHFDASGAYIGQWGSHGSGDGQFSSPNGIFVDTSGTIYVADSNNSRIQKFDASGNFITKWGSYGSGDGQFFRPRSIVADTSGNVFVSDTNNNRVQKFDASGNFITKWGSFGSSDGQFIYPWGLTVDSAGNVLVTDSSGRIQKFNPSGIFISKIASDGGNDGEFSSPQGITLDSTGSMYIADTFNYRVQKLNSSGNFVREWGSSGSGDGRFREPYGIAVDSNDNVYVADTTNYRIEKFDDSGSFLTQWGTYGYDGGEFEEVFDVAVDTVDNIYIADTFNHRIQKFDDSGSFLTQWGSFGTGNGQFQSPVGLSTDVNNYVYVLDKGPTSSRIQKFDSTGAYLTQWGSYGTGNGQFKYPGGLVVDADGNIYVADSGNDRIQKFDSSGTFLTKWGSYGTGNGQFKYPGGLVVDADGNIYVADSGNDRIQKFDTSGTFLAQWGGLGSGNGQLDTPTDLAVDTSGNVYVLDTGNNRIQYFVYFDTTPPVPQSFSPVSGSTLTTQTQVVTFSTDETATCRLSLSDESYDNMSDNVVCTGSGTTTHSCTLPDLGADGIKSVFIACIDSLGNKDTAASNTTLTYTLNSQAPTLSLTPLSSPTSNHSPVVTGTATDNQGTITSVEYQVDTAAGSWVSCVADDAAFDSSSETFTCTLSMSLSDGAHTIYVRATDNDSNTTLSGAEVTVGVRVDTTPPQKNSTQIDPVSGKKFIKTFQPTSLNNLNVVGDTHYPSFCFTRAYDDGGGLSHYTVVVDGHDYLSNIPYNQPPVGDNGDTRADGNGVIKENDRWYLHYQDYDTISATQQICAYGKQDSQYLDTGIHTWYVQAQDNAGNTTSTDTNRFLVMTNQGTQGSGTQSVWFPLTLLQVGNRTNLTDYNTTTPTLFTTDTPPLSFSDTTPTFFGIAPVGSTITLTLTQDVINPTGDIQTTTILTQETTANASSEWGINVTTPLTTGDYSLTIQATDSSDHFAILKDIPITLTTKQTNGASTSSGVLGVSTQTTSDDQPNSEDVIPSPTSQPTPTPTSRPLPNPTPTPKQFCVPFVKWCW